MSDITVDIDHVVLDGLEDEPRDARRLGSLIESALQQLIEERGLPAGLESRGRAVIAAPTVSLPPNVSDAHLAQATAAALYATLNRGT